MQWHLAFLASLSVWFMKNISSTNLPSNAPSTVPILSVKSEQNPSLVPTDFPTDFPSVFMTSNPSMDSTKLKNSSESPTATIFSIPTKIPSSKPTFILTTIHPSKSHSSAPSSQPSSHPRSNPSLIPIGRPFSLPSLQPLSYPSLSPTNQPFNFPSLNPLSKPTSIPTYQPTSNPTFLVTQAGSIGTDWWYIVTADCSVIVNKVVHNGEQINDPVTYAFSFALTDSLPEEERAVVRVSSSFGNNNINNPNKKHLLSTSQQNYTFQVTSWSTNHNIAKNVFKSFEGLKTNPVLIIEPLHEKDIREATDVLISNIKISTSSIAPPVIIPSNSVNKNINWDLILIILVLVSIIIIIIQLCSDNIKKTKTYRGIRAAFKLYYQRIYSIYKIIGMFMSSLHTACIQRYNRGFSLTSQLDEEDYHLDDFSYNSNHLGINHSKHRNDYLEDDDDETLSEIMISPPSSPLIMITKKGNNNSSTHYSKVINSSIHNFKNNFDAIQDDDL